MDGTNGQRRHVIRKKKGKKYEKKGRRQNEKSIRKEQEREI